jgi:hypothetical protein|tara:strand:- start:3568 stop:4038 length:471 start_codon:yes stop_codon:yes gene_type:complete
MGLPNILMGAATAMKAGASIQQGQMAMQSARYNARVIARQAEQEAEASLESMARKRTENERALSSIKLRMQESGLDTTQGSSADYFDEATSRLELQILDEARQMSFREKARRNEAQMQIYQGKVARANAQATAMGQLIGGAARISGREFDLRSKTK